ncbi:hypothetical protein AB6D60_20555, partial [Vibrio splendidus]
NTRNGVVLSLNLITQQSRTTVTTAEDGGITTHTIDVNVFTCRVTGSSCLESFDTGSRKMFINSPSKIFLNSLGGENIGFTKKMS